MATTSLDITGHRRPGSDRRARHRETRRAASGQPQALGRLPWSGWTRRSSRRSSPPSACRSASCACASASSGTGSICAVSRRSTRCRRQGFRQALTDAYSLDRPEVVSEQVSKDGTRKWLLRMLHRPARQRRRDRVRLYPGGRPRHLVRVEPSRLHADLLVLPHGITQRLVRNLTSAEIAAQLVVARDRLGDWPGRTPPAGAFLPSGRKPLRFQHRLHGHGRAALQSGQRGAGGGGVERQRGARLVAPAHHRLDLRRRAADGAGLGQEANAMLAISLHAVRDELRDVLAPLNRKYLIRTCSPPAAITPASRTRAASPSNTSC